MNQRLTKLNTSKKCKQISFFIQNGIVLNLISICFIMSLKNAYTQNNEPPCMLPLDEGTCDQYIFRYYFDAEKDNCERFTYKGCDGNANNFENYFDCMNACNQTTICPEGDPLQWDWIQDFIDSRGGCEAEEICIFEYNENTFVRVLPRITAGFPFCPAAEVSSSYYNCKGTFVCSEGVFGYYCNNPEFLSAAECSTPVWTFLNECGQDPSGSVWLDTLINNYGGCELGEIISIEYRGNYYYMTTPCLTENGISCSPNNTQFYTCKGDSLCGFNSLVTPEYLMECDPEFFSGTIRSARKLWAHEGLCLEEISELKVSWTAFPTKQKTWFEFSNEQHYSTSLYYANRVVENYDTIFYYMDANNTLEALPDICENYEDFEAETVDFISIIEPFVEVQGKYYFKDQLVFDTNLKPDEGIFIHSENYVGFDEVYIKCVKQEPQDIFGQNDEVKLFTITAYASGQPVESTFDSHSYTLSKSYGFLQFLPFIELLNEPKTKATITGFINEQGNLSGNKGVVGNNYQTPYEAGDVIYYSEDSIIDLGLQKHKRIWRDSITSITNYSDSLSYTFDRIEQIIKENLYKIVLDTIINSQNNIETVNFDEVINADVFKSIYGYALEKIPQNGNVKHFSIDQSLNSFNLEKDQPTTSIKVQNFTNVSGEDCLFFNFLLYGYEIYHSQLGKIKDYYRDDCCLERTWNIEIYKKASQTYIPIATLDSVYTTTDSPVNLVNDYHHTLNDYSMYYTISGSGVADNIFHPELIPDSLINVPFEITLSLGLWEFKQTVTVTDGGEIIDSVLEEEVFLKISPNPNYGTFNISSSQPYNQIKIYNTNGALVFSDKQSHTIYTHNLPSGVYLVELLNQNKVLTIQKLIVQ